MIPIKFWQHTFFLLVFCAGVLGLSAQVPEIERLLDNGKYYTALPLVSQKLEEKKSREWRLKLAICQFHTNQLTEAQKNLALLQDSDYPDPSVSLYLAKVAHHSNKFSEAITHYKQYLRSSKNNDPLKRSVVLDIKRCAHALKLARYDNLCVVDNLGEQINTNFDELAPIPSPTNASKIYFSTNRSEAVGGLRNREGLKDELYGNYCADMYAAHVVDGEWKDASSIDNFLNSPRIDRLLDISADGKILYYFKGFTPESGDILIDTFKITPDDGPWELPKLEAPVFPIEGDVYFQRYNPSCLIFASQRIGGFGGYDLYWTEYREGAWSEPVNFGPQVNSPYDEICPFLSNDGRTLFFSRNSEESIGGFDIFKSKFEEVKASWTKPVNVGIPINSPADDLFFRLASDGQKAFFCSNRKDGYGGFDIYDVIFNVVQVAPSTSGSTLLFTASQNVAIVDSHNTNVSTAVTPPIKQVEFSSIYYDLEEQLLGSAAMRQLNRIAKFYKEFPETILMFSCHSDETESPAFDLYFGIKRMERYVSYLVENGVPADHVEISSSGSNYPLGQNFIDGQPNPSGQSINRRIDLAIANPGDRSPIRVVIEDPVTNKELKNSRFAKYQALVKGLHYRIQIASIKQMYKGKIINRNDAFVDKEKHTGLYRYYVGLFDNFADAAKLLTEVQELGVKDAFIVPFANVGRIDKVAVQDLKNTFPDLLQYIKFYKIK